MNEIKFRAWDKEKGVMLTDTGLVETSFVFGSTVYGAKGNSGFSRSYSYYGEAADEPEGWGRPDDLVWMQYTGLKDKNGVEIYEGDVVELNVPTYKTTTKTIGDLYDAFILDKNVESSSHIEVIGNVYEDKEVEELEE